MVSLSGKKISLPLRTIASFHPPLPPRASLRLHPRDRVSKALFKAIGARCIQNYESAARVYVTGLRYMPFLRERHPSGFSKSRRYIGFYWRSFRRLQSPIFSR